MSSYDQNLLGDAPKATRAQLQQGYSVELLGQPAEPPRRTPSVRSATPHTPQTGPGAIAVPLTPAIPENASGEKFESPVPVSAPKPKVSFWRTRNGIIALVVLALVVIGAVVGGAVGGTVGKKSSNNNVVVTSPSASPTTSSTVVSSASQGAGSQPSASQQVAGGPSQPVASPTTTTTTKASSAAAASPTGNNIA